MKPDYYSAKIDAACETLPEIPKQLRLLGIAIASTVEHALALRAALKPVSIGADSSTEKAECCQAPSSPIASEITQLCYHVHSIDRLLISAIDHLAI